MAKVRTLRPDQVEALEWLQYRTEAFVILPIGFGKTIVTLTALSRILKHHPDWRTLVVSTKNIVQHTWGQEIEQWDHLSALRGQYRSAAGRDEAAVLARPKLLGVNFESLEWLFDLSDEDPTLLPEMLVIDESSKMKSHDANRVKRLAGFGKPPRRMGERRRKPGQPRGYVHHFKRRFALSATPAPEGYTGLWAQEACISLRRRLGKNITEFRGRYCGAHWNGVANVYTVTKEGESRIEEALRPITFTARQQKYMDLPDPLQLEIQVPWAPKALEQYQKLESDLFLALEDGGEIYGADDLDSAVEYPEDSIAPSNSVDAPNVAVLLNKLRQTCSGFVYDEQGNARLLADPEAKLRALEAVCERAAESPVLVFTQYTAEAEAIGNHFRGAVVGLPKSLDDWNAGRVPMLVLHPRSAGHGLNLQMSGSHICVFYSLPWSYEDWFQAYGRLHRSGQTRQVSVIRLVRPGSVEEDVWDKIQTKERRLSRFIENMKARKEG